jgi:trk system potassium uptake protein TrkA
MRIVILGGSRFGVAIAEEMMDAEHEVVIIDKRRERLEQLAEVLDCGFMEGDGTMPGVLREVFRDENDVFVAVANASEDNILASVVARSVGFGRVIPQIMSSELLEVCRELELEDVINPHATVAESIAEALEDRAAIDHETALNKQLALKRVHIPARHAGKTFGDLDLPGKVKGVALIRGEEETLLNHDTELQEDDHLLLVLARNQLDALSGCFKQEGE